MDFLPLDFAALQIQKGGEAAHVPHWLNPYFGFCNLIAQVACHKNTFCGQDLIMALLGSSTCASSSHPRSPLSYPCACTPLPPHASPLAPLFHILVHAPYFGIRNLRKLLVTQLQFAGFE